MKKRVLSMLMTLALCLTTLPTAVFADVTENGEGSGGTHYVAESGGTQYETVQKILDNMEEGEITLLDSVTEGLTVYAATTIHMNGHSITGNIDATDSLTLNDGDFVTVIGGNGAGKSTMLNAVAGVWPVDEGKILIDGVDVTRLSEHQRAAYIGRVFQDPMTGTAATMQIEENLALAARRGKRRTLRIGITKAEREQYRELLKTLDLGLEDRLPARVGLLSGGQRQALTLLMATMNQPKLLLLDEHTAALDPKTALKVLTLSAKIVEENHLTTMMLTHNMKDAIKYGTRLIMM